MPGAFVYPIASCLGAREPDAEAESRVSAALVQPAASSSLHVRVGIRGS